MVAATAVSRYYLADNIGKRCIRGLHVSLCFCVPGINTFLGWGDPVGKKQLTVNVNVHHGPGRGRARMPNAAIIGRIYFTFKH